MSTPESLKYKDLTLNIDISFWYELERRKLDVWKLEEPTIELTAWIPSVNKLKHQEGGVVTISAESFNKGKRLSHMNNIPVVLRNFNTIEQLTGLDKKAALATECKKMEQKLLEGDSEFYKADDEDSSLLTLVLWTFADLKTHKFSYIAAFPTIEIKTPENAGVKATAIAKPSSDGIAAAAKDYLVKNEDSAVGASAIVVANGGKDILPFSQKSLDSSCAGTDAPPSIALVDSSEMAEYPGWALRNLVCAIRVLSPKLTKFNIVLVSGSAQLRASLGAADSQVAELQCSCEAIESSGFTFKHVGWVEKSISHVEMGAMMDPTKLADSSANLNLGLMKWRMMPDIELEELKNCKALLLGSGTLGCNVARHLMMWGVRHITMVDRGNVSYSNPVRQSLFELSDVTASGDDRVKSIAAVKALKRILPTVNATGVQLTIRMPGHRVDDKHRAEAVQDIETLEKLIKEHDVIYLLTDSRESRWLPTVISTAYDKPVINSALGFDTWMVMRHGLRTQGQCRVGCYFCNDVVAPLDSLTARTLDQQCTVTRPGVSAVASSLAVEILAAMYNHKKKFDAPPFKNEDEDSTASEGVLGIVPHQIRGSVSDYGSMTLHGPNYSMCTGCSDTIVDRYLKEGVDFLIKCLNSPEYMEEITGLKAEKEKAAEKFADWDDDEFDMDDEE